MNTIVEFMVFISFQVSMDRCWQSMILELIQIIHHVSQTPQVFLLHFLLLFIFQKGNNTPWQYNGPMISLKSSLTISPTSLQSNQTYQFMIIMTNRHNLSQQTTGYLLIQVNDNHLPKIVLT